MSGIVSGITLLIFRKEQFAALFHTIFTKVPYFITEAYRLSDSQIDELNKGDSFSNSSLRRKLFGNDSNSSDSLESSHDTSDKNHPIPSTDCWDSPPLVRAHIYVLSVMS